MKIRTATMDDLNEIANVEAECFPAAEAATKEEFVGRIRYYGNHFWIMLEEDKLIAFVDGFVTDEADLTDENNYQFLHYKQPTLNEWLQW